MTRWGGRDGSPVTDRAQRLAYFDEARRYTPFLATPAGEGLFLVKTEDKHIARSLFGKRARGELAVLGHAVSAIGGLLGPDAIAGRVFIDVGANIGTTTIPAVLSHGFERAIAIEPEPENVRVLRLNVLLNDLEDRVEVLAVAASSELGDRQLVVNRERSGKHWIATERSKLRRKSRGPDTQVLTVPAETLDHLVEVGIIDPQRTGLLWMDAEAHEGHILEGASALLERGTPLVTELNPVILERAGDPARFHRAAAESYTHFAPMHRNHVPGEAVFPLHPVDRLPRYAERFLDRAGPTKTEILLLRLSPGQAQGVGDLDLLIKPGLAEETEGAGRRRRGPRGLLAGLRERLRKD